MRPEIVAADRRFEVRRAAASWERSGAIAREVRQGIDGLYADDRVRTSGWFRLLFFVFTCVAAQGALGFFGFFLGVFDQLLRSVTFLACLVLASGAVMAVLTEVFQGRLRLRRFGVEESTGWMAVGGVTSGLAMLVFDHLEPGWRIATTTTGAVAALFATLAALRWGLPLAGAVAGAAAFVTLAPCPFGRWLWIALALPLAFALERAAESASAAPAHRVRAREAWWVALAALYLALHVASVEIGWFDTDRLFDFTHAASRTAVTLSWTAMIVLPLLLIATGIATRRRPRLDAGLLLATATGATAIFKLRPQPLWPTLLVLGLVLVGLALALGRWFRRAPERTIRGWTSEALFEDGERAAVLEMAGAVVALSPRAREAPPDDRFAGKGGEFGGGGASSDF
ncbi:MAG: hypothetical protein U0X73_00430 [Thermoanaerobaculia bacterium]